MADRSLVIPEEFFHDNCIRVETLGPFTLYARRYGGVGFIATDVVDGWTVTSEVDGEPRDYPDASAVAAKYPAFAGLDVLVNSPAVFA